MQTAFIQNKTPGRDVTRAGGSEYCNDQYIDFTLGTQAR
jgi:hypothetical protein